MGVIDNDDRGRDVDYVASGAGSFDAGQGKGYAAVADSPDLAGGFYASQGNRQAFAFGADLARGLDRSGRCLLTGFAYQRPQWPVRLSGQRYAHLRLRCRVIP